MKKVKVKVAAGVVAVGMVASMGTVFAATDAGSQLQGWYLNASNTVKEIISGDFASYQAEKQADHKKAVEGITKNAREDVRDAGRAELASTNESINAQVEKYVGQINSKQAAITGAMPGEYNRFVSETNGTTNGEVAKTGAANETSINNAIRNHNNWYQGQLTTGVNENTATQKAVLEQEIASTQAELKALLAGEQTEATNEVKAHLDSKLAALQAQLQTLANKGVAQAEKDIKQKGDELLKASLSELDSIVDGIDGLVVAPN
ncbi:hypothetical protein [Paenibacillus sp. PL2-23]|uniref:hypothetical protein n=1 Tax=Paenibacillus sp. PL2-23 TaxID=2100729 RepID=UPI0030F78B9E